MSTRARALSTAALALAAALASACASSGPSKTTSQPAAPVCREATLGLEAAPISRILRRRLALPDGFQGAVVREVVAGGPAAQAGIEPDDVVVAIGGRPVGNDCDFDHEAFGRSCDPVDVSFRRLGVQLERRIQPVEERAFYEKACAAGVVSACHRQAGALWRASGGRGPDADRALELYQKACLAGSSDACADEGHHLLSRPGRATDTIAVLELSCDLGNAAGCAHFAFLHATGKLVAKDEKRAANLYAKSCDLGDAKGCYNAGVMAEDGRGIARDLAKAIARYEEACAGGSATGCTNLGFHYENGRGVRKDPARAFELYRRGCDGGSCQASNLTGCVNVGRAYRDGIGTAKDPRKAAEIFREACDRAAGPDNDDPDFDANRSRACSLLGALYLAGDGVEKDADKGRQLSELGCERGDSFGCFNAAVVAGDPSKAAAFLDRACQGGDGEGCRDLGVAYEKGNGVPRDRRKAAELYRKACELGFKDACRK